MSEPNDPAAAGAGRAGVAAALSSSRLGQKMLSAEASGAFGGMGTFGLVANRYDFSDGRRVLPQGVFRKVVLKL